MKGFKCSEVIASAVYKNDKYPLSLKILCCRTNKPSWRYQTTQLLSQDLTR